MLGRSPLWCGRARVRSLRVRTWLLLVVSVLAAATLPRAATAADLNATPSTFASVWASAQGGDRILLASGSYG